MSATEDLRCPVCGYPGLTEPPRTPGGGASFEICPSCGFQFGVSDDDLGWTYAGWRGEWARLGRPWSSKGLAQPRDWDSEEQLKQLGTD